MSNKEQLEEISLLFRKLQQRQKGAEMVKVDLHVHSPASKDYCKVSNKDEVEYKLLIDCIAESDVSIVAITDHNTFHGYKTINEMLRNDVSLAAKVKQKLILPGVEITCYGIHFLVLFPLNLSHDSLDLFLTQCGIEIERQGHESASADLVSPLHLCNLAEKMGAIVIPAHVDAEYGLLYSYIHKNDGHLRGATIQRI